METADQPHREKEIFGQALDLTSSAERLAFLKDACGSDTTLLERLQALLQAHEAAEGFLPDQPAGPAPLISASEKPGDRIGRYKLREKIGEGGCGVVYVAEQEEPVRRKVALKIIKLGMDTKNVIARFEAERQALALMDHPNIAKVHDAGATESGRPYFVMELVSGLKITDYCDQHQLPTRERLELFIKVCQAVQHAHQKGIIHRDLKPSNILVTVNDGVPVPKVIDFGIAKATGERLTNLTVFTDLHQFIGTPAYMSPEQAMMTSLDIDTRSDIYSLGVLLYELLTGHTPFDTKGLLAQGVEDLRRTIREREPKRPSTRLCTMLKNELTTTARHRASEPPRLIHLVRGDLDWIAMKCLEKDRARRYETANGLAADLLRHLHHEPVVARPPGQLYQFQKLVRRNKLVFAAAGIVAAVLVVGLGVSTGMFFQEREARRRAVAAEEIARQNLYVSDMNVAKLAWDAGNLGRARELLNRHRPAPGETDIRGFEWRYLWSLCRPAERASLPGHAGPVNGIAISPDGKMLATAQEDKTIRLWDVALQREAATLTGHQKPVTCVAFSPDGKRLASGGKDHWVILWDIASRTKSDPLVGHSREITAVGFTQDGKTLVSTSGDTSAKLWNMETLQEIHTLSGHGGMVTSAAFSPDGKTLGTGSTDGTVKLWDVATGRKITTLDASQMYVWSVAFSTDGRTLALGLDNGTVGVWDLTVQRELISLPGHRSPANCVRFSPDGKTLASGSLDDTIRLWSTHSWSEKAVLRGHVASISAVAFMPDSRTLISGSFDKTVKFWDADPAQAISSVQAHALGCTAEFSPNGKTIASASPDGTIKFWDVARLAEPAILRAQLNPGNRASFSIKGSMLASGCEDRTIKLWDVASRKELAILTGHTDTVTDVTFLKKDYTLVSCSFDKTIRFWDLASFRQIASLNFGSAVEVLALSADGQFLAAGGADGSVSVFDASRRVKKFTLRVHDKECWALAFSPSANSLATGAWDGTVKLWDLETKTAVVLRVPVVNVVAFSSDGKTLVTGSADKTIRFWNLATKQELFALEAHLTGVDSAQFSPSGDSLLTSGVDGKIKLWSAPTLEAIDLAESGQVVEKLK